MIHTPITRLAEFLATLTPESVPGEVAAQADLCLLDTLGCMIAGAETQEAQQLLRAETATNPGDICSVAGGGRHSLLGAARINAYQGDIFELNDLIAGHASIGNVAAALALGEARGVSGSALRIALVAGIETSGRIYNAFYPYQKSLDEVGTVSVGLVSSVGAAAACARLLNLTMEQTAHALAIAAGWANWCPAEVIFGDGGAAKPMLFGGLPATSGISAALAAAEGMTGPLHILDSDKGYFATMAHRWDASAFETSDWALAAPRRKLHACCGYIHSAYDSAEELVTRSGLKPDEITSVIVEVPPYIIPAIRKAAPPTTPNEARFHMQYMLAQALAGAGPVTPRMSNDFTAEFARPEIRRLTDRVTVIGAEDLTKYHQSRLTIRRTAGQDLTAANNAPRGTAQNPLDRQALTAKFIDLSTPALGESSTHRILDYLTDLALATSVSDLGALIQAKVA